MAQTILTNPNTNQDYIMEYEIHGSCVDHRGFNITITDWHVLHPDTLDQMGISKPVEIFEYLYDLKSVSDSILVSTFVGDAIYFLTDGCLSRPRLGQTKNQFVQEAREFMEMYTRFRAPYHLWTRVWANLQNTTRSQGFSGLLSSSSSEDGALYRLRLAPTRVHYREVSSSPELNPSCSTQWLGRKNYSFKMTQDEHNFFRHEANEFYDTAFPSVGVPMFGLELEVSTTLHTNELQYIVCDIEPKQEPFFVMKEDSSISGSLSHKYEIVTVPASPRYLKKAFSTLFKKLERLCQAKGKTMDEIFDLSTDLNNGIHIHIDRRSFHQNRKKTHVSRFLSAFNLGDEQTAALFSSISRRPGDYRTASYCSIDNNLKRYTTGYKLKEASRSGHRGCTSMRQSSTVEVRIFQGIVDVGHIRSCIEATQAMLDYTHMMPLSTLNRKFASGFRNFVLKSGQYNNLRKELK